MRKRNIIGYPFFYSAVLQSTRASLYHSVPIRAPNGVEQW